MNHYKYSKRIYYPYIFMSLVREYICLPAINTEVNPIQWIIKITQNWKYFWHHETGASLWLDNQKRSLHADVNRIVLDDWTNYFLVKRNDLVPLSSTSNLRPTNFRVKFFINWVHGNDFHWHVNTTKIPKGGCLKSSLQYEERIINLISEDINLRNTNLTTSQYPAPQEYSYSLNNIGLEADAYLVSSAYFFNIKSMMAVGNELRRRHIAVIINHLNQNNSRFEYLIKGIV